MATIAIKTIKKGMLNLNQVLMFPPSDHVLISPYASSPTYRRLKEMG